MRTRWEFYSAVEEIFSKDPNIVSAVSVSTKPFLTTKKIPGPDGQEMRVQVMEVVGNLDEEYVEDGEAMIADKSMSMELSILQFSKLLLGSQNLYSSTIMMKRGEQKC